MIQERKILVIGCPGAGKSTFARSLHKMTGIPLYYLDMLFHRADRTTVSEEIFDEQLNVLLQKEKWIIDGNYLRTLPERLKYADMVFFLDYPLDVCLDGVRNRIGRKREDMPWVEEEFDAAFEEWIRNFAKNQKPVIEDLLKNFDGKVVIFSSRHEAGLFLEGKGNETISGNQF